MADWSAAPAVAGSNMMTWPWTNVCGIPTDQTGQRQRQPS